MKWKPKTGDIVYVPWENGPRRSRVIGEVYDSPITDVPGNILETKASAVNIGHDPFSPNMQSIWSVWRYDLLGSVRARLEKKL